MNIKRTIMMIIAASIILIGGVIGYSWQNSIAIAHAFSSSGYVLVSGEDATDKQAIFEGGTKYRSGLSDTIRFKDVQGNKIKIPEKSFVHYDDDSISALTEGVVVDLNDINTTQVTNHYAVSPEIEFKQNGGTYTLSNTASDLQFKEFMWKLGADKYLVCASNMTVHFGEGDDRNAGEFIEVSYIDDGVIQIQTEENIWQTVSKNCYAILSNGQTVDLSYKNVKDENGNILMDFAKVVLDSDDNIEIIPLGEDVEQLSENIIPQFDINAQPGEDGEAGENGEDGQQGEQGQQGQQGEEGTKGNTGSNGAKGSNGSVGNAGSSGTDGAAGAPGESGNDGANGKTPIIEGTVLDYPVFTLNDWKISSTYCSGTIKVSNGEMLERASKSNSELYIVDMTTNERIEPVSGGGYEFKENEDGYPFKFENLVPDHNYRLVVSAMINTGLGGAEDYSRDFISKVFWTDSLGIYLEARNSKVDELNLTVVKQEYAPITMKNPAIYLYSSKDEAENATVGNMGNTFAVRDTIVELENSAGKKATADITFNEASGNEIEPDKYYYARIVAEIGTTKIMMDQILPLQSLKRTAVIDAPSLTPNRENWGFDIIPGVVSDPDNGMEKIYYEFYSESDVKDGELIKIINSETPDDKGKYPEPVKTITATDLKSVTAALDGSGEGVGLRQDYGYYVRAVIDFYDNEKSIQIVSGLSNRAQVTGGKLPSVYFQNSAENDPSITSVSDISNYYHQLYGDIVIAPGVDSDKVMLDYDNQLTVTIRAAGYYYVKYPVYLNGDPDVPVDPSTYLKGEKYGEYIYIDLPAAALTKADFATINKGFPSGNAAVYGLRPNTQYQVIVTGNFSEDGKTPSEINQKIGSCVIETPDTVVCNAVWADKSDGKTAFAVNMKLMETSAAEKTTFEQQSPAISSVTLTLNKGTSDNLGEQLGAKLELTEDNFKGKLDIDVIGHEANSKEYQEMTLAELLTRSAGITLTEEEFGLTSGELVGVSYICLTVSDVYDYTIKSANRENQKAYTTLDSNDGSAPEESQKDGNVYKNKFRIDTSSYNKKLNPTLEPIPTEKDGFKSIEKKDEDKDNVDEYVLTPNYKNEGKLAKHITYYVFDEPDYTKNYDTNEWEVDYTRFPIESTGVDVRDIPKTPVTVRSNDNNLPCLASVRVAVPQSGELPKVKFIPMTKEVYYKDTPAALSNYVEGQTKNDKGEYIFFFKNGLNESATGHQYVFAWTFEYKLEDESVIKYYPFEHRDYAGYKSIPCSKVIDSPRAKPIIYALPYTSSYTDDDKSVTWAVYVYDPDGAVIRTASDDKKAILHERANSSDGTTKLSYDEKGIDSITIPIYDKSLGSTATLLSSANLVKLYTYDNRFEVATNLTTALKVQYYTDKYTLDYTNDGTPDGLYKADGTLNGYIGSVKLSSGYANNKVMPYCIEAFTFHHDPENYKTKDTEIDNVKLKVKEATVGGESGSSDNVNRYEATVSGPKNVLKNANGIRLIFTDGTHEVALDKTINLSIDTPLTELVERITETADGNNVQINFPIHISRELAALAGKDNVTVKAELLFENGKEGYSEEVYSGKVVSMISYSWIKTGIGYEKDSDGRYLFDDAGNFVNQNTNGTNILPRWGSFVTLQTPAVSNKSISVDLQNTRHNGTFINLIGKLEQMDITGALGSVKGILTLFPRQIEGKSLDNDSAISIVDKNGKPIKNGELEVPEITPNISYYEDLGTSNSVYTKFVVNGDVDAKIYFEVYKLEEKEVDGKKEGVYVRKAPMYAVGATNPTKEDIRGWETDSATAKYHPTIDADCDADSGIGEIEVKNLERSSRYKLVAYYKVGEDYIPLNTLDNNGNEIENLVIIDTLLEPNVSLNLTYIASNYHQKRIGVRAEILDASNYYYTLRLLDKDGNFISNLDSGSAIDNSFGAGKWSYFDFGSSKDIIPSTPGSNSNLRGNVYKTEWNTVTHELEKIENDGEYQRIYLNYGEEYQVYLNVYQKGTGPAYKDNYDLVMDSDSLIVTDTEKEDSKAKVTVSDTTDYITMTGMTAIKNGYVTISFTPSYKYNNDQSKTIRGDKCAVAIMRYRDSNEDGTYSQDEIEDITQYASYVDGNSGVSMEKNLSTDTINFGKQSEIVLDNGIEPDLIKAGDKFTCYMYGIQDNMNVTNTGGVKDAANLGRHEILAGRVAKPTGDQKPLTTPTIAVYEDKGVDNPKQNGVSKILDSFEIICESTETSAGKVFVVNKAGTFTALLNGALNVDSIKQIEWTVSATYREAGELVTIDSSGYEATHFTKSGSTYSQEIYPSFVDLPQGANIEEYIITLEFFMFDDDGNSQRVPLTADGDAKSKDGYKLTQIFENKSYISALMMSAMEPEELVVYAEPAERDMEVPEEILTEEEKEEIEEAEKLESIVDGQDTTKGEETLVEGNPVDIKDDNLLEENAEDNISDGGDTSLGEPDVITETDTTNVADKISDSGKDTSSNEGSNSTTNGESPSATVNNSTSKNEDNDSSAESGIKQIVNTVVDKVESVIHEIIN